MPRKIPDSVKNIPDLILWLAAEHHSGRWQWRIESDAVASLRDLLTHETIAEFPVPLLVAALSRLDTDARVTASYLAYQAPARKPLASVPARASVRALGVPLRHVQEARRAQRAANSTHKGRNHTQ